MSPNMSDLDFIICCTVTFFSKKKRTPLNLNNGICYSHFVIKGTEEYLGVNFINGEGVVESIFQQIVWE